jgi:hypothetical protein
MDADNDEGWPEFKLYGMGSTAIKTGNLVEIRHTGNADNLMIPTGKAFNNFAALYLSTGDENAAYMLQQYCKGLIALFQGFIWSEDDPEIWSSRAPTTCKITTSRSRRPAGVRQLRSDQSAQVRLERLDDPVETNPYYGSIWTRTMRSKDDMPHFYRMVPICIGDRGRAGPGSADAAQMMLDAMSSGTRTSSTQAFITHEE